MTYLLYLPPLYGLDIANTALNTNQSINQLLMIIPAASNNKIVCEFDTKPLTCPTGTQIQIRTVNFGRTNSIVCKKDQTIDCYSSGRVTGLVAQRCNGNDLCQVSADGGILGEDPCPSVPKYLDILWDCNPLPTTTTTPPTTTTLPTTTTTAAVQQNLGTSIGANSARSCCSVEVCL